MINKVDEIQEILFLEWNPNVIEAILNLMEEFVLLFQNLTLDEQNHCLLILSNIEKAIKNHDYLLIADLLEFDIKPVLKEWWLH